MIINTRMMATLSLLLVAPPWRSAIADCPMNKDRLATLIQQLGAEDAATQKTAVDEIHKLGPKVIADLVSRLGDSNDRVTFGLWLTLQRFGIEAVPELLKATKSDDDRRARGAVSVLGALRTKSTSSIPELLKLSGHRDESVRVALMDAFGAINDARAIPTMIRLADSDPDVTVRNSALSNMTLFGKDVLKEHIPELISIGTSIKGDSHESVKSMAFVVVAQAGSEAIPHLVKIIDGPGFTETAKSRAIWCVYDMAKSVTLRKEAATAIPCLIRVLRKPKSSLRPDAAHAIGMMGKLAGEAVPWLEKLCQGPAELDQIVFAGTILQIDSSNEVGMGTLLRAAEQKVDRQLRSYSLQRLRVGRTPPTSVVQRLVKLLDDTDPMVRRMTCSLLADLHDEDHRIEVRLKRLAITDSDAEVRKMAEECAKRLGGKRSD